MKWTQDDIDALCGRMAAEMAEIVGGAPAEAFDPGRKGAPTAPRPWEPLLSPTQREIFYDKADVVGACGEKFTGKSIVFLDKIVGHCFTEFDALATIIGNSHRALAEGVCNDLTTFTLLRWRDGNREPLYLRDGDRLVDNPRAGELIDNGIGLEFSPWKSDPNNKDLYLKIRNRFGGWSRIRVIAIPFAEMVQARVTNLNASLFYLEEATRCNGADYYKWPSLQLYRRRGIKGTQPFLFSCNPDEPSEDGEIEEDPRTWVHRWMYRECRVARNQPGRDWPDDPEEPGIRRDPQVAFYSLKYDENRHNVSSKNREIVERTLRHDPIMRSRLLHGRWVAKPAGDALFKAQFDEKQHIKGDIEKKQGLVPIAGHPIVMGMDWGPRNFGLVFKQVIESEEGPFEIEFDELTFYQEMHKTEKVARAILEKMRFWTEWLRGDTEDQRSRWSWWFIAGDDVTTNYNPESGSIHARDIEDHMRKIVEEEPERFAGIALPKIRGCPRPKESVEKRVDITAEILMENHKVVSALCPGIRGMYYHLPRDKDSPSKPMGGNRWIHIFDAASYVTYYRRFVLPKGFYNFSEGAAFSVG